MYSDLQNPRSNFSNGALTNVQFILGRFPKYLVIFYPGSPDSYVHTVDCVKEM